MCYCGDGVWGGWSSKRASVLLVLQLVRLLFFQLQIQVYSVNLPPRPILQGDGRVAFLKAASVPLVLQLADGMMFREDPPRCPIQVSAAVRLCVRVRVCLWHVLCVCVCARARMCLSVSLYECKTLPDARYRYRLPTLSLCCPPLHSLCMSV